MVISDSQASTSNRPMKPVFLKVCNSPEASIDIRHEIASYFKNPWHFHPEYELTLILESSGTQFIGNSISPFYKNELTFTGPNLPHYWRNDPIYYQDKGLKAEAIIIRFHEDFLGKSFFNLPEMQPALKLFKITQQGLQVAGATKDKIAEVMRDMLQMNGAERIIALLQILNLLTISSEYKVLSNLGFAQSYGNFDVEKINDVYSFVMERFMFPIHLSEVAGIANMNRTAFCRYFKSKTGKTFVQFLQEIRIGHACKLLIHGNCNVSEVCYQSGFHNQSYFIKQFKKMTGQTPLQYQNSHHKGFRAC